MIPFEDIDSRLEKIGQNRAWLVTASGRSENSIRAALAPGAPASKRSTLLQKALSDAIEREESSRKSLPPGFTEIFHTDDDIHRADQASRIVNAPSLAAFCHDVIQGEARRIIASQVSQRMLKPYMLPEPETSKVAEDETPYKFTPYPKANIQAAAGSPIFADVEDWDGSDDTVMVKINGLSMVPLLNDGEVITMKHRKASRSPHMKKGLVYLVEYDGGYTVKRYNTRPATTAESGEEWVDAGKVKVLESINPEFPEIIIKQELEWVAWLDDQGDGRREKTPPRQ